MIDYVASVTAILFSFGLTLCVLGLVCCLWQRTRLFGMLSVFLSLFPLIGSLSFAEQLVALLRWTSMDLTQLPQDNLGNLLGLGSAFISFLFCLLLYLLFTKPRHYTNYTKQGYSVNLTEEKADDDDDDTSRSRRRHRRSRDKRAEPQLNASPSLEHLDFADIDNEPIFADDSMLPTAEMLSDHDIRGSHGTRGRKEPKGIDHTRDTEESFFPLHDSDLNSTGTAIMRDQGGDGNGQPSRYPSNRNRSLHLHSYDNPLNLQDVQEQSGADFTDDDPPLQLDDSPDARLALSPLHDISSESEPELELELLELAGSKVSDLLEVLEHSESKGGRKMQTLDSSVAVGQSVGNSAEFTALGHFAGGFATMLDQEKTKAQGAKLPPSNVNVRASALKSAQKVMSLTGASPETSAAYEANSQLSDSYDHQQLKAQEAQPQPKPKTEASATPSAHKRGVKPAQTTNPAILKSQAKHDAIDKKVCDATAAKPAATTPTATAQNHEPSLPDLGQIHVWGKFFSHLKELFTILESDFGYSRELISYIFMLETEPPMQSRPLFSLEGFIDNSSYVEQSRFTATFHENNLRHLLGEPASLVASDSQIKEIKSATVAAAAMAAAGRAEQQAQADTAAPESEDTRTSSTSSKVRASAHAPVASLRASRHARAVKGARATPVFAPSASPAPLKATTSATPATVNGAKPTVAKSGTANDEAQAKRATPTQMLVKGDSQNQSRSGKVSTREVARAVRGSGDVHTSNAVLLDGASKGSSGAETVASSSEAYKRQAARKQSKQDVKPQTDVAEGLHNESDVLSDSVIPNVQSLDKINQNGFIGAGLTVAEALAQLGSEVISTANAIEAHNKKRAAQPSLGDQDLAKHDQSRGAVSVNKASKTGAAAGSATTTAPKELQQSQAASLLASRSPAKEAPQVNRTTEVERGTAQVKSTTGAKTPAVNATSAKDSALSSAIRPATVASGAMSAASTNLNPNKRAQSIFRTSLEAGGAHSYSAPSEESSDYVLLATMRTSAQDTAQAQQQSYLYQSAPLNISIPVAELNASASNVLGGGLVLVPAAPHNLSVSGSTGLAISNAATGRAPDSAVSSEQGVASNEPHDATAKSVATAQTASATAAPVATATVTATTATPVASKLQLFSAATGKAIDPSSTATVPAPASSQAVPASSPEPNANATPHPTEPNTAREVSGANDNMASQPIDQGESGLLEVVKPTSALVVQSVAGGESHLAQLNGTRPAVPVQPVTPDANTKIVTRAVVTPPLAPTSEPVSAQVPLSALAISKTPASPVSLASPASSLAANASVPVLTPLRSHVQSAVELRENRAKLLSTLKQRRRLQEQQAALEFAEKTMAQTSAKAAPQSEPTPVVTQPLAVTQATVATHEIAPAVAVAPAEAIAPVTAQGEAVTQVVAATAESAPNVIESPVTTPEVAFGAAWSEEPTAKAAPVVIQPQEIAPSSSGSSETVVKSLRQGMAERQARLEQAQLAKEQEQARQAQLAQAKAQALAEAQARTHEAVTQMELLAARVQAKVQAQSQSVPASMQKTDSGVETIPLSGATTVAPTATSTATPTVEAATIQLSSFTTPAPVPVRHSLKTNVRSRVRAAAAELENRMNASPLSESVESGEQVGSAEESAWAGASESTVSLASAVSFAPVESAAEKATEIEHTAATSHQPSLMGRHVPQSLKKRWRTSRNS